jgi:hypothetical protein
MRKYLIATALVFATRALAGPRDQAAAYELASANLDGADS